MVKALTPVLNSNSALVSDSRLDVKNIISRLKAEDATQCSCLMEQQRE